MIAANTRRSSSRPDSFFISDTITIAVVRLSSMALRKKVTKPTSQTSATWLLVRISEVTTSKPLWASITSTIVIAPIRKKMICAVAATDSLSSPATCAAAWPDSA